MLLKGTIDTAMGLSAGEDDLLRIGKDAGATRRVTPGRKILNPAIGL